MPGSGANAKQEDLDRLGAEVKSLSRLSLQTARSRSLRRRCCDRDNSRSRGRRYLELKVIQGFGGLSLAKACVLCQG